MSENKVEELIKLLDSKIEVFHQTGCTEKDARCFSEILESLVAVQKEVEELQAKKVRLMEEKEQVQRLSDERDKIIDELLNKNARLRGVLENLLRQNNHTIEEEKWRIVEALKTKEEK